MFFAIATVEEVDKLTEVVEEAAKNPDVIKVWMESLPQKALDLGIRTLLTLALVVIGVLITSIVRKTVKVAMNKMNADAGTVSFTDSLIKIVFYGLIILVVLVRYGVDAASIVAVIGSLGLTVGLAMQGALQNFAGGIIILCIKPFKVGDYICEGINKNEGTVVDIGLFYTEITTVDNRSVFLPNGSLANAPLINLTNHPYRGLDVAVDISYASDIAKAKEIALNVMNAEMGIEVKDSYVYVDELSQSGVTLKLRASVPTDEYLTYRRMVLERIKIAFEVNKIEIPYPQVDVHMK